jgi:hypothetical protein
MVFFENYAYHNTTIIMPSREIKTCEIFGMSIAFCFGQHGTDDGVFSMLLGFDCRII